MTLEYKPGKENRVADALSRKAELAAVCQLKGTLIDRIRAGTIEDPMAQELVKLAREGRIIVLDDFGSMTASSTR